MNIFKRLFHRKKRVVIFSQGNKYRMMINGHCYYRYLVLPPTDEDLTLLPWVRSCFNRGDKKYQIAKLVALAHKYDEENYLPSMEYVRETYI